MQQARVIQIGIGGFGRFLLDGIVHGPDAEALKLVAVVDPYPENAGDLYEQVTKMGIPVVATLDDLDEGFEADLAVIGSPIPFHAEQAIACMQRGWHVLCEKPVAGTLADAQRMATCAEETGKQCGIGFQWSYAKATQNLKQDIMGGRFGEPQSMRGLVLWPRAASYYSRNNWAGKRIDPHGRAVGDHPVANATAHFLHHMLYLLGDTPTSSAHVLRGQAELYKANTPVETFDSAALRLECVGGVAIDFLTAHTTEATIHPVFVCQFSEATLHYSWNSSHGFVAHFSNGQTISYGNPEIEKLYKIKQAAEAATGNGAMACPVEAALPHMRVSEALTIAQAHHVPEEHHHIVDRDGSPLTTSRGLDSVWVQAMAAGKMPHELDLADWTRPAQSMLFPVE